MTNRLLFIALLLVSFCFANSQELLPAGTDSLREVDLSNLIQDGRTMIALTFGQSNAGNHGQVPYTPKHISVLNYYKGKLYTAKDPLLGTTGVGGSVWTHLGDMLIDSGLYNKVIFIPVAVGGTPIACWTTGDCSNKLKETLRILDSQHIKLTHVFWHQGESDNIANTSKETYKKSLDTIVNTIRMYHQDADIYISIASYYPNVLFKPLGVDSVIRKAQIEAINENNRVLLGPDTDRLIYAIDRYDSVHFSDFGMNEFAQLWLKAIKEKSESFTGN